MLVVLYCTMCYDVHFVWCRKRCFLYDVYFEWRLIDVIVRFLFRLITSYRCFVHDCSLISSRLTIYYIITTDPYTRGFRKILLVKILFVFLSIIARILPVVNRKRRIPGPNFSKKREITNTFKCILLYSFPQGI